MYWGMRCPDCDRDLDVVRDHKGNVIGASCPQGHYTRVSFIQPTMPELFSRMGFDYRQGRWNTQVWAQGWGKTA